MENATKVGKTCFNGENVNHKIIIFSVLRALWFSMQLSKRRLKKQCIERQRREAIKKSLDKLALLVPEAKERVKLFLLD